MNGSDAMNGFFELMGGLLLFRNCLQLWRDREVRGVKVTSTAFFMAWGYWNLFFYPANRLWLSFAGGVVLVTANTLWVGMAWWFERVRRKNRA